jgi:methylamine dehydrogenase accessory protein MauD
MTQSAIMMTTYVALWILVLVQTLVLLELLRQIGILRMRVGEEPGALVTSEGLERGSIAPAFVASDVGTGREVTDALLHDRTSLIVFLTPTCQSCRSLAPDLRRFSAEHREIQVLVICAAPREHCEAFAREFDLRLPVLVDEGQRISRDYRAIRTPSAILIDPQGQVRIQGLPNSVRHLETLLEEEGTPMHGSWIKVEGA